MHNPTFLKNSKVISILLSSFILSIATISFGAPVSAATTAIDQCNSIDNTGGLAVECDVTVTNNLDQATGVTSSTTQVRVCRNAAGELPTCTTNNLPSTDLVGSVNQCNDAANGGGATVYCKVRVINNITGNGIIAPATVNQCIGSGTGGGIEPTIICDPLEETTGATITQCNGSANGGGASLRVECNVLASTVTSALPTTVNQCNGSANGGGSLVKCDVQIMNNIIPPTVVTPPVVTPPAAVVPPTSVTPPAVVTPPKTVTPPTGKTPPVSTPRLPETGFEGMSVLALGGGILLAGFALMAFAARRKASAL